MNFPRQLLYKIRRRPGMYLYPAESLNALLNVIRGFWIGYITMKEPYNLPEPESMSISTLEDDFLGLFSLWCQRKFDIELNMTGYWPASLQRGGNDDKQSFHAFFQLLDEFEADVQQQGEAVAIADLLAWEQAEKDKYG